jgi:hypothetical protein
MVPEGTLSSRKVEGSVTWIGVAWRRLQMRAVREGGIYIINNITIIIKQYKMNNILTQYNEHYKQYNNNNTTIQHNEQYNNKKNSMV